MTEGPGEAGREEGLATKASTKVDEAASAAQEKASELREQGSARLRDQLDRRSSEAGSQVRSLAQALRQSGEQLEGDGKGGASRTAREAADRIERLGGYLERKSGDDLMRDVEMFARRRPWLLAGIGLLAGVAAARFVKASSERRYDDYRRTSVPKTREGLTSPPTPAPHAQPELAAGSPALGDEAGVVGSGVPAEPLARDPYTGTR